MCMRRRKIFGILKRIKMQQPIKTTLIDIPYPVSCNQCLVVEINTIL